MFTGIVEETGTVRKIIGQQVSGQIEIQAHKVLDGTALGDSIAVNGVCLTVTRIQGDVFTADVMAETLRRTNLGSLPIGAKVNLERAMAANGRFGGHIVSGHIDGTGTVQSLHPEGNAVWVTIAAPEAILRLIIEKGSIAIDGISLTVAYVDDRVFKVSIIPHTGEETTLLFKKAGDIVNLENDVVGKYVERLLVPYQAKGGGLSEQNHSSGITMDFLAEHGF
ncbi:MAG: riboflavin synthase [Lachnospiraceae bacterium]|nr:riboflavin synthase [Lachnospiraceae bacterium]